MPAVFPTTPSEVTLGRVAGATPLQVYRMLGTSAQGLLEAEVARRQHRHGENVVDSNPRRVWRVRVSVALRSPFLALLAALDVVFVVVGDARGAVTLAVTGLVSVVLRLWQQTRSERAVNALRSRVRTTVTVRRRAAEGCGPARREVPLEECVPGDVVLLGAGDVVPADVRLVTSSDLCVDHAVLTGESLPATKSADADQGRDDPAGSPALCLAGTTIVSGSATGVVVATGTRTYSGTLARGAAQSRPESAFDVGVRSVASSNFGNVLTVLAASVFLPFLPMLPLQLVVQNLPYDAAQLALPWDRVDHGYLGAPRLASLSLLSIILPPRRRRRCPPPK